MRPVRAIFACALLTVSALPILVQADTPLARLTIQGPQYALVDDPVFFGGSYQSQQASGLVIPATRVRLYVDGAPQGNDVPLVRTWQIPHVFEARGPHDVFAVAQEGDPIEERSFTLRVHGAVPPTPATNVAVTPVTGSVAARVTWDAPADSGGSPITRYDVYRREDSGPWTWRTAATAGSRAFTDAGLVIGRAYSYRVTAVSVVAAATPVEVALAGEAPLAPSIAATAVDAATQTRVLVASGGGPAQQIVLERSTNGGAAWSQRALVTGTSLDYMDAIPLGSAPLYRATARSLVGDSPAAMTPVTGDLPGTPLGVSVSVPDLIRVQWSPPVDGGAVQGYRILVDGVQRGLVAHGVTSFSLTTTPGAHDYAVVATSAVGDGAASAPVSLTLDVPDGPASLSSSVFETDYYGYVDLAWTAPPSDGGAPIREYRVYRWTDTTRTLVATLAPGVTTYRDGPLTDGRTYGHDVVAVNAVGTSPAIYRATAIPDFDWELAHALARFEVCETIGGTPTCTNVPSGGTFNRAGTGSVTYTARYEATLTRMDVPKPGVNVWINFWPLDDDELTSSDARTTDAAGQYTFAFTQSVTPVGCNTYGANTNAWSPAAGASTRDTLVICP